MRIERDVQQAEDVELQSLELDGFPTALLVSYDEPGPTAAPVHRRAGR